MKVCQQFASVIPCERGRRGRLLGGLYFFLICNVKLFYQENVLMHYLGGNEYYLSSILIKKGILCSPCFTLLDNYEESRAAIAEKGIQLPLLSSPHHFLMISETVMWK